MSIGERLRELRKSRRLTLEQVGRELNVSGPSVSRYETNSRQPAVEVLQRFADFYGVSMDYLYGKAPVSEGSLSDYERDMIAAFRKMPDDVKDDIVDFMNHKMSKREALRK